MFTRSAWKVAPSIVTRYSFPVVCDFHKTEFVGALLAAGGEAGESVLCASSAPPARPARTTPQASVRLKNCPVCRKMTSLPPRVRYHRTGRGSPPELFHRFTWRVTQLSTAFLTLLGSEVGAIRARQVPVSSMLVLRCQLGLLCRLVECHQLPLDPPRSREGTALPADERNGWVRRILQDQLNERST